MRAKRRVMMRFMIIYKGVTYCHPNLNRYNGTTVEVKLKDGGLAVYDSEGKFICLANRDDMSGLET